MDEIFTFSKGGGSKIKVTHWGRDALTANGRGATSGQREGGTGENFGKLQHNFYTLPVPRPISLQS